MNYILKLSTLKNTIKKRVVLLCFVFCAEVIASWLADFSSLAFPSARPPTSYTTTQYLSEVILCVRLANNQLKKAL